MAHYRKIDARIWNDEKFSALSERGKLSCFFILTHPNLTMLGAMRASITGLAAELFSKDHSPESEGLLKGLTQPFVEGYAKGFMEVSAKGIVKHDDRACFIWLPNFLKYNRPDNPNVVKSWPTAYDLLPECQLKLQLFHQLKGFIEGFSEPFQKAFAQAFGKGLPNGMAIQEQEQEQDIKHKNVLSEHSSPKPANGEAKPVINLLLNDGKQYPIHADMVAEWQQLYPAVDVMQQLRNMCGWLISNPTHRKTRSGILRFCNTWLKREQDKAPRVATSTHHLPRGLTPPASEIAAQRRQQRERK